MNYSRLPNLPASITGYGIAGVTTALVIIVKLSLPSKLDCIPTVGSNNWLGSWWAGLKYLENALDVLQEGYDRHKSAPFKIAELYRWRVIVSSHEHVEELQRAPDDTLSILEAVNEHLRFEYMLGPEIHHNPYHIPIVRSQLTRNLGALGPEIRNEIVRAFDDVLDLRGNEWKNVPALSCVQKIVCRTSNRVFVGLPLCRDPDWIDLNIQYTIDVIKGGVVVGMFPDLLKPIATRLFTKVNQSNRLGRKLLSPIIEERQGCLNEYGNEWADKPNDFLLWLMEEAKGTELSIKNLTTRILAINFAAIHTSSYSFAHALFYLLANPRYIQPLREEVEAIIKKDRWSKAALAKMRKVDSFLRECQRLEGIDGVSVLRKAVKDFTFSDGTFVPKGTMISAAARCVHREESNYKNANAFEPFRFAELREEDGEGVKHHFATTTAEYLPFGHGRHACPGRFFAANELKSMLAHVVVSYDIKFPENTPLPQTLRLGSVLVPDPKVEVLFRRRVD